MLALMMMASFYLGTPTLLALALFGWPNGRGWIDFYSRVWVGLVGALMAFTTIEVLGL